MEPFERFSDQKLENLRRRYRGDDLFRTWTRLLCILEQQLHGLNAVEVWSETEMVRQRLSEIKDHRDNDVEFLYGDLMKRHQSTPLPPSLRYSLPKCVMLFLMKKMMLPIVILTGPYVKSWLVF